MFRIELLSRAHDRAAGFDCGSAPLNQFLRDSARQQGERGISRTFVIVEEEAPQPIPIIGYFSLTMCQVISAHLPPDLAREFPKQICGVKLGRLAVATGFQGQRFGSRLLIGALVKAMDVFNVAGGVGVFVDAKDVAAKLFYERFGFVPLSTEGLTLFLPLDSIRAQLLSDHP